MAGMTGSRETELTVGQVADLVGVSVRTLHHWDQIGLVVPSARSWSGYRLYSASDIARIHTVLVYRETGMRLDAIAAVLDGASPAEHLLAQRKLVREQIRRLERMERAIDTMIKETAMTDSISPERQAEIYGRDWNPALHAEAEQKWGGTAQWQEYARHTASLEPGQAEAERKELDAVEREIAEAMARALPPDSDEAHALAERHRKALTWFSVSPSQHVVLARGYAGDPRFRAHYEAVAPGLADYIKSIIDEAARARGINPGAASWED